jgi:CHASE2 domain-containing sensor protein
VKIKTLTEHQLFKRGMAAVIPALCGLALWLTPFGERWENASYDYLFRFGARAVSNQIVLIEMDTAACAELHQTRGKWDRLLHARLLDHLHQEGCPLVVFDVWFSERGEAEGDAAFREALRHHEKVVLLAKSADPQHPRMVANQVFPPHPFFRDVATNWGIGAAELERDGVVRRVWDHPEPEKIPSLPWTAARLAGAQLDAPTVAAREDRWLRYYGPTGAWGRISYHFATNQPPGFYRDKIVFIGNRPETLVPSKNPVDAFPTPYTGWTGQSHSGMEIMATTFLNLLNRDWLRRLARWKEALILLMLGGVVGAGLSLLHRPAALALGLSLAVVLAVVGVCLSYFTNWWFPWLVVVGGQIPVAVTWVYFAGARLAGRVLLTETVIMPEQPQAKRIPDTPGYDLIEPAFGEGAYGRVWMARNAIGELQALKVMFRSKFNDDVPYDREFNGLRHYKPISSQHPGLLRIDFVSAKQQEGYFYYVMQLGDALSPGWELDFSAYRPRDLASACWQAEKKRLPVPECVRIGIALADALAFLHKQDLIHRDIKPSNVIFVKGEPKLADLGLVTGIRRTGRDVSLVGTPDYMSPEGPGEPQADIYALGMVLYTISTGGNPSPSLDLSPSLVESVPGFLLLNKLLQRACAGRPENRYATAVDLRDALKEVDCQLRKESTTR